MPRMKALRDLTYANKAVSSGTEFEAGDQEARTLTAIGYATASVDPTPEYFIPPKQDAESVEPTADAAAQDDASAGEAAPKRGRPKGSKNRNQYDRRDLRAKE